MPGKPEEERKLLFVSMGVVLFSVLAIVLFLMGITLLFYISALLAVALGFYLSRSLSNSAKDEPQRPVSRKQRPAQGS